MREELGRIAVIRIPEALILDRNDQEADHDQDRGNVKKTAAAVAEGEGLRRAEEIEVLAVREEDLEVTFGQAEMRVAVAVEN